MTNKKEPTTAKQLNKYIVKGIQEKKGTDIVVLDLTETGSSIADFFILCTGNSETQLDAILESVEKEVQEVTGETPWHREGLQNKEWILLDYVDVVVHIFKRDVRSFYSLETLWGDAKLHIVENQDNDTEHMNMF
jgi:ribosome-associated protein